MRQKKEANADSKPSVAERMRAAMTAALSESDRTGLMSAIEFFKDFHEKAPNSLPSMVGNSWLTREEESALGNWARLARESDATILRTVDANRWMRIVRLAYVTTDRERRSQSSPMLDIEQFANMVLARAKNDAQDTILSLLHYCPCYLFETKNPTPVRVGPVEFIPSAELAARLASAAGKEPDWMQLYQSDLSSPDTKERSSEEYRALDVQRMASFPWIAIVSTEGYESGMAQQRADDMARLALAGLGLWLAPGQCASMSLAHEWRGPFQWNRMFQVPGRDVLVGYDSNHPQVITGAAHVQELLTEQQPYFNWVGQAIREGFASTPGTAGSLREAWLNALYWYYCGCVEKSDPRASICFTSALESLCDTHGYQAIISTLEGLFGKRRDDIILPSEQWSLGDAVQQIYGVGRSESVHGGRFVLFREYQQIRNVAAMITRLALLCFQDKLGKYEQKYNRAVAADSKSTFLKWLSAV